VKEPFSDDADSVWKTIPTPAPSLEQTTKLADSDELFCPRCSAPLIDAPGLGLCQSCGYCRSLEEGIEQPKETIKAPRWVLQLGLLQFWLLLGRIPIWGWGVLAATVAVLMICYVADHRLPVDSPQRAYWSTIQLGVGLAAILAAQVWALIFLRKQRERVGVMDLLCPSNLWYLILRWVPHTNGAISLAGGGATAALTAVLWIGGLSYWLVIDDSNDGELHFGKASLKPEDESANRDKKVGGLWGLATKNKDKRNAPRESPAPRTTPPETTSGAGESPSERPDPAKTEAARCVITGYVLDDAGELTGLVVATSKEGKLTSAGVVRPNLTPEERRGLLKRLSAQHRDDPAVDGGPKKAQWVNPVVLCTVKHAGTDKEGQFVKAALDEVIDEE
jgi:hypothetical protein